MQYFVLAENHLATFCKSTSSADNLVERLVCGRIEMAMRSKKPHKIHFNLHKIQSSQPAIGAGHALLQIYPRIYLAH